MPPHPSAYHPSYSPPTAESPYPLAYPPPPPPPTVPPSGNANEPFKGAPTLELLETKLVSWHGNPMLPYSSHTHTHNIFHWSDNCNLTLIFCSSDRRRRCHAAIVLSLVEAIAEDDDPAMVRANLRQLPEAIAAFQRFSHEFPEVSTHNGREHCSSSPTHPY